MTWMRSFRSQKADKASVRKPAARTRPAVEALEDRCLLTAGLDPNLAYVQALYHDDLGRDGSPGEAAYWANVLQSQGLAAVAAGIEHSGEAREHLVQGLYQEFLGRAPQGGEEQGFVKALQSGSTTAEQVAAAILGSGEFFNRAPNVGGVGGGQPSNDVFITALYQELLSRAPKAGEVSHFVANDLTHLGREAVALEFLKSSEFRTEVVTAFYTNDPRLGVLHRHAAPSDVEVGSWVGSGLSLGDIHFDLEASPEKFALNATGFDANQRFVQGLYQDSLGRLGTSGELGYWEQVLLTQGPGTVVNAINHSPEAMTHLVDGWYATVLGRSPVNGEEQSFVNELRAGKNAEQVLAELYGSDEFFNYAPKLAGTSDGVSNQAFTQALFHQLLGRDANAAELNAYTNRLEPTVGRAVTAQVILESAEYRTAVVNSFYATLLGRQNAPTAAEVSGWVNSHVSLWSIQNTFESTGEFLTAHPRFVTLGDSLTDEYTSDTTGLRSSAGDQSWVEQLETIRATEIQVTNLAHTGATSTDLLHGNHDSTTVGQPQAAAGLIKAGQADYAVVLVGANDILAYLNQVAASVAQGQTPDDGSATISTIVTNLAATLDTLQAAGHVHVVVGTIPDVGQTPYLQQLLAGNSGLTQLVTGVTQAANQQIKNLAAARGLPVVDLYSLGAATATALSLDGVPVAHLFAPDGFHPGTPRQALLINAVLEAEHEAYGLRVAGLKVSNEEILAEIGQSHSGGPRYFDVHGFVIANHSAQYSPLTLFNVAS